MRFLHHHRDVPNNDELKQVISIVVLFLYSQTKKLAITVLRVLESQRREEHHHKTIKSIITLHQHQHHTNNTATTAMMQTLLSQPFVPWTI